MEYIDFLMISELYHCTPEELDRQDSSTINQHLNFMRIRAEEQNKDAKRAEQRARLRSNK
jgi:hypothetical protein